jgi:cytosine/adenosine deaminase-related metal-dependent hydrolase
LSYRYRAQWVLPIVSPPIRDGWVTVDNGRIVEVGPPQIGPPQIGTGPTLAGAAIEDIDLGRVALLPGLINAHTHLELSWLWGKTPPADSLPAWVGTLLARRAEAVQDDPTLLRQGIVDALEAGTAAVGDISNTLASVAVLAESPLHAVVFREIIGFNPADPARVVAEARAALLARQTPGHVRLRLAPHAPYSVAPTLIAAIAAEARQRGEVTSIHLGESPEETAFLAQGAGPWRDLLQQRGVWPEGWRPPACSSVEHLDRLGALSDQLLVVHGVQFTDRDLETLAARGCTLVTCPRSNLWVGVGAPPVERFYTSGVRVAIGTDSLASNSDLNLFSELALLHGLAPAVPPARLLASATREGALALGLDDMGLLAPGALARIIAIDLPIEVRNVEEYLVEGIEPTQIAWVPPASGPFAPVL